jgi:hypothetical protein
VISELWLTFYDSTKSYKLEQRLSQGSPQAHRISGSAKRNCHEHKHMLNRCSTSTSLMRSSRSAGQSSGVVKWKLETLKHIFNRRTTGAQLCAPVCGLFLQPQLEPALQKFTSEGFFLDPGPASEEVLASIQFYANIHFYDNLYSLISFLRT